jgi:hypothetical protein
VAVLGTQEEGAEKWMGLCKEDLEELIEWEGSKFDSKLLSLSVWVPCQVSGAILPA